ncbi:MAG: hypothetical protein AAFR61_13240 [Bacteroidota bacterium]
MRILFLLFLGLSCLPLSAQNELFIPFGQNREEVKTFLSTRNYISLLREEVQTQSLRALLHDKKRVEYVFAGNELYATSVSKSFTSKRRAKLTIRQGLHYMRLTSGKKKIKHTRKGPVTVYTVLNDTRMIKLFVIKHEKKRTVQLTSISLKKGPIQQQHDFYYEVKLMRDHRLGEKIVQP